jgi:voltage-gated potassium channel
MRLRRRAWVALEGSGRIDRLGFWIRAAIVMAILANAAALILETVPAFDAAYRELFRIVEVVTVSMFAIEYAARVWVAPEQPDFRYRDPLWGRLRYVVSPLAVIDLVAILPIFLRAFGLADLSLLRLVRLIAVLKLTRSSPALQAIGAALWNERKTAVAALSIIGVALIFVSTVMWYLERDVQPEKFGSIPAAMWWGIVTLTTIGFGDVVPVTVWGKIFGGVVAVMGIFTLALPVAILAGSFSRELTRRDFNVTVPMLARMRLLSEVEPFRLRRLVARAEPRVVAPRHAVVRREEAAAGVFFVIEGCVEIERADRIDRLGPGEAFGAATDHASEGRHVWTAVAVEPTRLVFISTEAMKDAFAGPAAEARETAP